jgi:iron(III) transport system substrate-binding protein
VRKLFSTLAILAAATLTGCGDSTVEQPQENLAAPKPTPSITVYSARKEHLIKPMFDLYTANTGVEIRYITDKAGPLLSRLKAEGETTPADLLMTVDAGNLWQADQQGVLRVIDSEILNNNVPTNLRATDNTWFGLSERARTIVYATDRVSPDQLSTYEALADPEWQGRLCLRTSKKVYNQSLVATMIANLGVDQTEEVVKGWVANLATAPFSNDTKAMEAVMAGQCDATIVNTYYYGRLKTAKPNAPLALFWPNQDGRGVHINVSGAGVTKYAKQPAAAQALLEWLTTPEAQQQFASLNQEIPVNKNVPPSTEVQSWGSFKADPIQVEQAGALQIEAVKLMDRAGYN